MRRKKRKKGHKQIEIFRENDVGRVGRGGGE